MVIELEPTGIKSNYPKAAIEHECSESTGIIQPGETYWRLAATWGGVYATYKVCEECLTLRTELEEELGRPIAMGWLYDELVADPLRFANQLERYQEVCRQRGGHEMLELMESNPNPKVTKSPFTRICRET